MHSAKSPRRAIKEEGRRAQIIAATVFTLAELGYVNTSLAKIAKRAGISTSLILYHFKDKDELMAYALNDISAKWYMHVQNNIRTAKSAPDKLHAYIRANLMYMVERPEMMAARIEIIFNKRDEDGRLFFQTESHETVIAPLEQILEQGRRSGDFQDFTTASTAIAIRAAIDQFLGLMNSATDAPSYIAEITRLFDKSLGRSIIRN
ncbi:MAG TPA: TetR/AcrR family transcriptional regulator [Verrucomicrobiae bacterium]|nr:TetR/AcrR family transcriptional regulator [Verrucomicrobiae bacterium]